MVATNTLSNPLPKILKILRLYFPYLHFVEDSDFFWSPTTKTIHFNPDSPEASYLLLHEASHGILDHQDYDSDIDLLRMEIAAWNYAQVELQNVTNLHIPNSYIQTNLDTYREWLYQRSLCPECNSVALEQQKNNYSCLNCSYSWLVNDARTCRLKRSKPQVRGQSA